jgi:predicted nucleic acid-binding protein
VISLKAYLDSNILISYLWWWKSDLKSQQRPVAALAQAIESKTFEPIISEFSLMEVSHHFSDYHFLRLMIEDGYSYKQLPQQRLDYSLSKDQEDAVTEVLQELENNPLFSVVSIEKWEQSAFESVKSYTKGYVEIVDAIHLQVAVDAECDYLITGDKAFRRRVEALVSAGKTEIVPKVVTLETFLQLDGIKPAT